MRYIWGKSWGQQPCKHTAQMQMVCKQTHHFAHDVWCGVSGLLGTGWGWQVVKWGGRANGEGGWWGERVREVMGGEPLGQAAPFSLLFLVFRFTFFHIIFAFLYLFLHILFTFFIKHVTKTWKKGENWRHSIPCGTEMCCVPAARVFQKLKQTYWYCSRLWHFLHLPKTIPKGPLSSHVSNIFSVYT